MRKRDVKRLLRMNPAFESWLLQDSMRAIEVRMDPGKTKGFYKKWKQESWKKIFSIENITEKSKRASDMLTDVQTVMEMMTEQNTKKEKDTKKEEGSE